MSTFITKIKYALGIFLSLSVLFFSALSAAGYQIDWPQAEPSNEPLYCAVRFNENWVDWTGQDQLWIDRNCTGKGSFCESEFKMDPDVIKGVGLMHIFKTKTHPNCLPEGEHVCSAKVEGRKLTLDCMGQGPIEYERFL